MAETVVNTRTCTYADSGDIRITASPVDTGDVGVVYIQERIDGTWHTMVAILNPTPNNMSYFGATVHMVGDGKFILVGGTRVYDGIINCGIVNVYELVSDNTFIQVGCIPVDIHRGSSVAFDETLYMSNDRRMIVVGGGDGDVLVVGVTYIYNYQQRSWLPSTEITEDLYVPNVALGYSKLVIGYTLLGITLTTVSTILYFL